MKKTIKTNLLLLLLAVGSSALAAPRHSTYHWVVETAPNSANYTVYRIYQHDTLLVYEEVIPDKKLDIRKKKVRRQLDKGLSLYLNSVEQLTKVTNKTLLRGIAFR
jgi:hypothetical protein